MNNIDRRKFLKVTGSLAVGGVILSVVGNGLWKMFTNPGKLFNDSKRNKGIELLKEDGDFVSPYRRTYGFVAEDDISALEVEGGRANINKVKELSEGLAVVISTQNDALKQSLLEDENSFALKLAKLTRGFDHFYLGLDVTSEENYVKTIREFAFSHGYKLLAFPSIKYIKKEDAIVLEMMKAIDTKEVLEIKSLEGDEYFKTPEEIAKLYTEEEIKNVEELAKLVNFEFVVPRGKMISWFKETGKNSDELIRELALQGLKEKGKTEQKYIDRINFELDTIKKMGYSDYFLIVHDYIEYAKTHDIAVGPGRGSASGSLVSYALGITVPDPLEYNLLFERFLNPARQTMPDIDVDFSDIHREDVVNYIREKYGVSRVARIMAIQKLGAKAALNDVGRIFNYEKHDIELFTKLIKDEKDDKLSLREIYKTNAQFRDLVNNDKYYLEIVTLASKIEGLPRQAGMHAAGIVLNNEPLENALPVTVDFQGNYITQYEMGYLEQEGFLKMDFLSLRNLTIIALCVDLVNKNHPEAKLTPTSIPYDSKEAIEIIKNRHTMGVFQLESQGMKRAIKILKPNCFDDIVALVSLFRPGPMDQIKLYSEIKEGKKPITFISDALSEVLRPTNGIIIFQEQVNSIAQVMAGFSPSEADIFRRAISKKDKEKILKAKEQFVEGSISNGYSEKETLDVFNLILKFANYGFNKSHAVVYSIIACRLAYLKAHYPLEFYAAILEIGSSVTDSKFNEYVTEMKQRNFKIHKPNINESSLIFTIKEDGLLFPLNAIHGVNVRLNSDVISEIRNNGPFKDFFDFVLRMYDYKITETQVKAYIASGALDTLYPSRASMKASLKGALQFAELNHNENGQLSMGIMESLKPAMTNVMDNPIENLNDEYDTIGIMLSDNPLRYKKDLLNDKNVTPIVEIQEKGNFTIAGIIKTKKVIKTKKDESMAFIKIFDETGEMEVTVFSRVYVDCYSFTEKNKFVLIKGKVETDDEDISMIADSVELLEE